MCLWSCFNLSKLLSWLAAYFGVLYQNLKKHNVIVSDSWIVQQERCLIQPGAGADQERNFLKQKRN